MMNAKVISFCNDLLAFEHVAVGGYETAIHGLREKYPAIGQVLLEFLSDHQRHVRELETHVIQAGGEPRKIPGVQVVFRKPLMELRRLQGAEALLGGMVSNEESACQQYDWAQNHSREQKLPQAVVDTCRRAIEDERRHLAYCVEQYESFKTGTKVGSEERRPRMQRHPEAGRGPAGLGGRSVTP
jgi:hypothetical protein